MSEAISGYRTSRHSRRRNIGLEDLDADIARKEPAIQCWQAAMPGRRAGIAPSPDHLPREDVAIDIEERVCPAAVVGDIIAPLLQMPSKYGTFARP